MHKRINEHEKFIISEIEKIENEQSGNNEYSHKKIKDLIDFHHKAITNFQHERLIHLIVTFFFALLLIKSVVGVIAITFLSSNQDYSLFSLMAIIICVILFITELFYIKHYYHLENGTQKLYVLSNKLFNLLKNK